MVFASRVSAMRDVVCVMVLLVNRLSGVETTEVKDRRLTSCCYERWTADRSAGTRVVHFHTFMTTNKTT